jgi:hypothetical protein
MSGVSSGGGKSNVTLGSERPAGTVMRNHTPPAKITASRFTCSETKDIEGEEGEDRTSEGELLPFKTFVLLSTLDLSLNQLTTLPSEIANLPALSSLNLMRNRLIELPKSV